MKKILLSIGVVLSAAAANAQVDTLTEFFTGTPTIYGVSAAGGGGYLSGNNGYGDLTKMQLFDGTHGVNGGGSITSLLLWAPVKSDVVQANSGAPHEQDITFGLTRTPLM